MKRILLRVVQSLVLLWFVLTAVFFTVHLSPGDPSNMFFQPGISPQARELIKQAYGLDQPIFIQYTRWLTSFVQGDFGVSITQNRPVLALIGEALPRTVALGGLALLIDFFLGISIGILAAIRKDRLFDRLTTVGSFLLYSIPGFWLALMMILLFSCLLPLFPPAHMHSPGYRMMSSAGQTWDFLRHLILPALVLGISGAAVTNRFMRQSMIETLDQPFIRTAVAKGLPSRKVILAHALPNAIFPIITLFGMSLPFLVSGSLIIEVIFAWPGMGRLTYTAMMTRDYPLIIGTTFVAAVMVIAGNLLADTLYAIMDPRIRHAD